MDRDEFVGNGDYFFLLKGIQVPVSLARREGENGHLEFVLTRLDTGELLITNQSEKELLSKHFDGCGFAHKVVGSWGPKPGYPIGGQEVVITLCNCLDRFEKARRKRIRRLAKGDGGKNGR